ncbi:MAG: methyl-accepting chemotaxis protein [Comamonas sp.]
MASSTSPLSAQQDLHQLALRADRMVLGVLMLGAFAAVVLGWLNGPVVSGAAIALGLCAIGLIVWRLAPGSLLSRLTLSGTGMLMVALHIQLAMGLTELHFGVFVFLAFLLVYRDWRPILLAAATIAVHHIAFDRLQLMGWPVYCMTEPNFARVLLHAAFVVVQTTVEIVIALKMRSDAVEAAELNALCQPTEQGQLNLQVQHHVVHSRSAQAVRDAFLQLDDVVTQARATADVVLQGASGIAQSNHHLQQRTEHTAANLQQATAHMLSIKGNAQESAQEAQQARHIASQASDNAQSCGALVSQVVTAMESIHDSSRKIGDIVGLIDSIAFQTNILALNAAVEAARAGEHGKGFAVVASEVRSLAQRSAEAARDVRQLIQHSLSQASNAAALVGNAGDSMQSVVQHTTAVAQQIHKLSALAEDQARDLLQTSSSIEQLDRMTQENAQLVDQSTQSTQLLLEQATQLQQVVAGVQAHASEQLRLPRQDTPDASVNLPDIGLERHRSLNETSSPAVHHIPTPQALAI